uniref:AlNc14C83G5387 protein n=1 Tax=Albugo laibachii Nc14 TaxID=890382 RepID=F0WFK2_9STRA|nr:AlNc14C83G5387 [Albugo laibachii Nc14]|eukprot:CCA19984.1 AlNc14C83G5387 [Albugo laibachii Nc14]
MYRLMTTRMNHNYHKCRTCYENLQEDAYVSAASALHQEAAPASRGGGTFLSGRDLGIMRQRRALNYLRHRGADGLCDCLGSCKLQRNYHRKGIHSHHRPASLKVRLLSGLQTTESSSKAPWWTPTAEGLATTNYFDVQPIDMEYQILRHETYGVWKMISHRGQNHESFLQASNCSARSTSQIMRDNDPHLNEVTRVNIIKCVLQRPRFPPATQSSINGRSELVERCHQSAKRNLIPSLTSGAIPQLWTNYNG